MSMTEPRLRRQHSLRNLVWWALVLVPPLLGFLLRLNYGLQAEPFVDEPTTLLAAEAISQSGLPTLPSGLFYGNDLPYSYLVGGLAIVFGPKLVVLRLLSLAVSVTTIVLLYQAGKRLMSRWVGLWAALLLALSPAAIIWGGRARAYALLAFLAFVAVWSFYEGVAGGTGKSRRLGLLILVMAVFVHPEAALLLPAFVLGALVLKGWRWWLNPARLAELALASGAILVRLWLQYLLAQGWIGGLETLVGSRPPIELASDWLARLQRVSPFFLAADQIVWTALALLALVAPVAGALGRRWRGGRSQANFFFSVFLWLVPLQMILFLGSTYQSPRYLNMLLPIYALLAASGLDWLVTSLSRLGNLGRQHVLLGGLATILLVVLQWPGAIAASASDEKGFRSALEYVAQHWQPGDRVATVAPAYSQMVLGRADFFTLGLDYEEFVFRGENGSLVDRWMGSPLIQSAGELEAVLDRGERVWFVTDESRLRKRFDPSFAQVVWQRMELMDKPDQVMVFLSREAGRPAASRGPGEPLALFGGQVALAGYELGRDAEGLIWDVGWGEVVARPGQNLPLNLYWAAIDPVLADYSVFIHLLGPDGRRVAQDDGPPLNGLQPMLHWQEGEVLTDRRVLELPGDLPAGHYRLEIGMYGQEDGDRLPVTDSLGNAAGEAMILDYVRVQGPGASVPSPKVSVQAELGSEGEKVRLLGYDLAATELMPGAELRLALYWEALDPIRNDYTVFVHLVDGAGQIRGQGDGPPVDGFQPTSLWDPGEVVVDEHSVAVDAGAEAGTYRLVVGLYLPSTGQRLEGGAGDSLVLGEVQVGP